MTEKTETARGDYVTRGYRLVKEILSDAQGQHLSAEDIHMTLCAKGEKVGKTTVYRQLERLLEEGAIRRTLGEGVACYSMQGEECEEHYHLFCTVCGKMEHLACERVKQLFSHIQSEHGFLIDLSRTTLYGTCAACVRKSKQKEFTHAHAHP